MGHPTICSKYYANRPGLESSVQQIVAQDRDMLYERYDKPVRADETSSRRRERAGEGATLCDLAR
jgi:hypothetical protein